MVAGVRVLDVDESTETTFLHCLHDERPDDPRVTDLRRSWYAERAAGTLCREE